MFANPIRFVSVLLLFIMSAAAQTFIPFPDMARRPTGVQSAAAYDAETVRVKSALAAKLISENPFDVIAIANAEQYLKEGGPGFPWKLNDGNVKTWMAGYGFEAVMPVYNADGTAATEPNTDSAPSLQYTTRELQDFFKAYRSHFPEVPKLKLQVFTAAEAGRLQFGDGPGVAFPLAKILRNDPTANYRSTFPPGIGIAVKDGALTWFKLEEYRKAFPIKVTATVPNPTPMPEALLLGMIRQTATNPNLSPQEIFEALRRLLAN